MYMLLLLHAACAAGPSCLPHLQHCLKVVGDDSGALEFSGRLALQDKGHTGACMCGDNKGEKLNGQHAEAMQALIGRPIRSALL
jgi:hypothetical protein